MLLGGGLRVVYPNTRIAAIQRRGCRNTQRRLLPDIQVPVDRHGDHVPHKQNHRPQDLFIFVDLVVSEDIDHVINGQRHDPEHREKMQCKEDHEAGRRAGFCRIQEMSNGLSQAKRFSMRQ